MHTVFFLLQLNYHIFTRNDILPQEETISDLHRDEDLEVGRSSSASRRSNITESQERELARLGLICSDAEFSESVNAQVFF